MFLWKIPTHSPDLNPIEKFWSCLRRELRRRDFDDFQHKHPPLTKDQYIARGKEVLQTDEAKRKARNIAAGFRRICKEVADKHSLAARS